MDRVLAGARAVVGMAGYNTVAETLRARRPALLVPRTRPSQEQLVRARAVSQQQSYSMLLPTTSTPRAMRDALGALLEAPPPDAARPTSTRARTRSARLLSELADPPRARRHVPHRPTRSSAGATRAEPAVAHACKRVRAAHDERAESRHGPGGNSP